MLEYGSYCSRPERLPTLYEALKNGVALPKVSMVTHIFRPSRFQSIGLKTEHYRVNVRETSPLYGVLIGKLEGLDLSSESLAVRLDDAETCSWTLVSLDFTECDWVCAEWGCYVAKTSACPTAPKNPSPRRRKAQAEAQAADLEDPTPWVNPPSLR